MADQQHVQMLCILDTMIANSSLVAVIQPLIENDSFELRFPGFFFMCHDNLFAELSNYKSYEIHYLMPDDLETALKDIHDLHQLTNFSTVSLAVEKAVDPTD